MRTIVSGTVILILLVFSSGARAGREGNGGAGVARGLQLYLLDLYEAGPQPDDDESIFSNRLLLEPDFIIPFSRQWGLPPSYISAKIIELSNVNFLAARSFFATLKALSWETTIRPLPFSNDYYEGVTRVPRYKILQLALRTGMTVTIRKDLFSVLYQDHNKLALIFHEVMAKNYFDAKAGCKPEKISTEPVRRVVALLFQKRDPAKQAALKNLLENLYSGDCQNSEN